MASGIPNISKAEFLADWSALHNNAPTDGIVGAWLSISYRFGLIATLLRISPNYLTLFGLLCALVTALTSQSLWAIFFLVLSLFFDGIDGSVAIFQKRASNFGAILDSVADRISEALWLFALYRIGAPAYICILLWSVASVQEYARARIASLGVADIGVITPAERPVRASFLFIALIMWQLSLLWITEFSIIFLVVQVWSLIKVIFFAHGQLH